MSFDSRTRLCFSPNIDAIRLDSSTAVVLSELKLLVAGPPPPPRTSSAAFMAADDCILAAAFERVKMLVFEVCFAGNLALGTWFS